MFCRKAGTVSDTNVATITSDASPILTAVAVGQVTLTTAAQGISSSIQVNIQGVAISSGTERWSDPLSGFTSTNVIQALSGNLNGPDLYSLEGDSNNDVILRALTRDGQQLWQQSLPTNGEYEIAPDGFGGIVVRSPGTPSIITDRDGLTGSPLWTADLGTIQLGSSVGTTALSPNGDIVDVGVDPNRVSNVITLDGVTGQLKNTIPLTSSTLTFTGNCGTQTVTNPASTAITIDSSGNAYAEYTVSNETDVLTWTACVEGAGLSETQLVNSNLQLLAVSADGSSSTQVLTSRSSLSTGAGASSSASGSVLIAHGGIPDGQGGYLAAWTEQLSTPGNDFPFMVSHVSPSGNQTYEVTSLSGILYNTIVANYPQLAIGQNGNAFAAYDSRLAGFDVNSGNLSMFATPGPVGAIFVSPDDAVTTLPPGQFDSSPWSLGLWSGRLNGGTVSMLGGGNTVLAASGFPSSQGGRAPTKSSPKPAIAHFIPVDSSALGISPQTAFNQITGVLPDSTARNFPFLSTDASRLNFLQELQEPINAIGFIGHALEQNSNNQLYSVGMVFNVDSSTMNILVLPPSAPTGSFTHSLDAQYPVLSYAGGVPVQGPLSTDASVVFIGSCSIGPPFEMLWNINGQTKGKALIVPSVSTGGYSGTRSRCLGPYFGRPC